MSTRSKIAEDYVRLRDQSYTNDPSAKKEMACLLSSPRGRRSGRPVTVGSLDLVKKDMSGLGEVKSFSDMKKARYAAYSLWMPKRALACGIRMEYFLVDFAGTDKPMFMFGPMTPDELESRLYNLSRPRISATINVAALAYVNC